MTELLVCLAIVGCALSGVPGLFVAAGSRTGERVAVVVMGVSGALGCGGAISVFVEGPVMVTRAWGVPGGVFALRVDAIASMFLLQIFVVGALGAVYALEYYRDADHPREGRSLRLLYGLTVAGMSLLVVARNGILFLVGWEVMAICAFLMISTHDREEAVRDSGLVYLLATRVGTLALFAYFALLRRANGSFELASAAVPGHSATGTALLVLALLGFGLKAGAMPLHFWLPGAHANAPTHVSALMSGVLIKMGIYGLVRTLSLFPQPPLWWGQLLLVMGAISAALGVAFAIAQHDLKRLLAYHSVENIGIILMGLGVAALGSTRGDGRLLVLGLGGALLHTWNHGLFKALLFMSAGAVIHTTHTRDLDRLGGLARRMPWTTAAFVVGAVAICGLPPLNGFVSELLVYLGLFDGVRKTETGLWLSAAFVVPVLALVGGLAVACFVKVIGAVFLGEARTEAPARATEVGLAMRVPMLVLCGLCAAIGLVPLAIAKVLDRAALAFAGPALPPVASVSPLRWLSITGAALLVLLSLSALFLSRSDGVRATAAVPTWDCGYARPNARMQYTASSFAEWLVRLFSGALRPTFHPPQVRGAFPAPASFHSHVSEVVLESALRPVVRLAGATLGWFRWVQRGAVHLYLLYVLAALIGLLMFWR